MSVAAEIRAELARQQIPARALAEALGVSPQHLSQSLGLEKRDFGTRQLKKIGDFLGLPASELMRRAEENQEKEKE